MENPFRIDDSIDTVVKRVPATAAVLLRHRMACVGCAIASFHTVADVCAEYDLDPSVLIDELRVVTEIAPNG